MCVRTYDTTFAKAEFPEETYKGALARGCACCERYFYPHGEYCSDGPRCEWYQWYTRDGDYDYSEAAEYACCLTYCNDCPTCERGDCDQCDSCFARVEEWYEDQEPEKCPCEWDKHELRIASSSFHCNWCTDCWTEEKRNAFCLRCGPSLYLGGDQILLCMSCRDQLHKYRSAASAGDIAKTLTDTYEKMIARMMILGPVSRQYFG